jgi:hypothetical protein
MCLKYKIKELHTRSEFCMMSLDKNQSFIQILVSYQLIAIEIIFDVLTLFFPLLYIFKRQFRG